MKKTIAPLQIKDKPQYTKERIASPTMTAEELEECEALAKRFDAIANRTAFARENNAPGKDDRAKGSIIYSHVTSRKPISMASAIAYAQGFKCSLEEISPRLAKIARKSADLLPSANSVKPAFSAESHHNTEPGPEIKGRIPLISEVHAGMWTEAVDIYEPGYAERWLPVLKNNGENTFALRVTGDSMTARYGKSYPEGSIIFVNPDQRNPNNGDRIVAKLSGSEKVTFKVFTEEDGRRWLRALNDNYPPIFESFTIVGKVVGKWEDE